jgi:hypothetical protein
MLNAKGEMPNAKLTALVDELRASKFRLLAGARVSADVPLTEGLLNELIAASTPPDAPVRSVSIHPQADGRFNVRIVAKAALIPPITLKLAVDEQPDLPARPVLVLRMVTLGGLFGLASGVIAGFLPPSVKLQGERIFIDLRALAAQHGAGDLFEYVKALRIRTAVGRVLVHVDAAIDPESSRSV